MDAVVAALREQQAELAGLVQHLGADELSLPSRCAGWSVADVLLHLAQTDDLAVASVAGDLPVLAAELVPAVGADASVDDLAGDMVDAERTTPTEARDRWLMAAEAEAAVLAEADPAERVLWVAGEMSARTLASTRLTETWIHTVDVAVAFGPEPEPTDRLWHTARLVWRTVPYALARGGHQQAGEVAIVVEGPSGATWTFGDPAAAVTVVTGTAHDLCTVAGQRAAAADTGLRAEGPDAEAVLESVRTFA